MAESTIPDRKSAIDNDPAWDIWFDVQYDVNEKVNQILDEALEGRPKPFKVAVLAAVLEGLAERLRIDIDLPPVLEQEVRHG